MTLPNAIAPVAVALSISEPDDLSARGMGMEHLDDAFAEIARHLLARGAQIVYGGDLRAGGFTEVLFELVARHTRERSDEVSPAAVLNFIPWPVHITMESENLIARAEEVRPEAELLLLGQYGEPLSVAGRAALPPNSPGPDDWAVGLTSARRSMTEWTSARIVLGGRRVGFRGSMPGVAEEALLSMRAGKPLFVLGGFGGCVRDISRCLALLEDTNGAEEPWAGRAAFEQFSCEDLNNGLSTEENRRLAQTTFSDEAVVLILGGLIRLGVVRAG